MEACIFCDDISTCFGATSFTCRYFVPTIRALVWTKRRNCYARLWLRPPKTWFVGLVLSLLRCSHLSKIKKDIVQSLSKSPRIPTKVSLVLPWFQILSRFQHKIWKNWHSAKATPLPETENNPVLRASKQNNTNLLWSFDPWMHIALKPHPEHCTTPFLSSVWSTLKSSNTSETPPQAWRGTQMPHDQHPSCSEARRQFRKQTNGFLLASTKFCFLFAAKQTAFVVRLGATDLRWRASNLFRSCLLLDLFEAPAKPRAIATLSSSRIRMYFSCFWWELSTHQSSLKLSGLKLLWRLLWEPPKMYKPSSPAHKCLFRACTDHWEIELGSYTSAECEYEWMWRAAGLEDQAAVELWLPVPKWEPTLRLRLCEVKLWPHPHTTVWQMSQLKSDWSLTAIAQQRIHPSCCGTLISRLLNWTILWHPNSFTSFAPCLQTIFVCLCLLLPDCFGVTGCAEPPRLLQCTGEPLVKDSPAIQCLVFGTHTVLSFFQESGIWTNFWSAQNHRPTKPFCFIWNWGKSFTCAVNWKTNEENKKISFFLFASKRVLAHKSKHVAGTKQMKCQWRLKKTFYGGAATFSWWENLLRAPSLSRPWRPNRHARRRVVLICPQEAHLLCCVKAN